MFNYYANIRSAMIWLPSLIMLIAVIRSSDVKLHARTTAVAAFIFAAFFAHLPAYALTVEYDLTIAQQKVNITGNPASGMTINGAIPGPTLHFKEGDTARIYVHNKMSVETSIHRQCD